MIKRLLERVYYLLDQKLNDDTREVIEAKLYDSEQALEEAMVTIEDYQEEIYCLKNKRWA